mmetsp:Transcript_148/g.212  ORF Transcript_148/g.212 Transcript_148/m.212 type:complete len:87 (+) Transcript_148:1032-1292(+)
MTEAINWLENASPKSFLSLSRFKGYSTLKSPMITATFWNAMSKVANLKIVQQRIIRQYLSYHLGLRISVPEQQLRELGSKFCSIQL